MANLLLQVTIPAGGKAQVSSGLPAPSGGPGITATAALPGNIFVQQLIFQNNATHSCRIGDTTVSATKGIALAASGTFSNTGFINYGTYLSDWWIFGTAGDVIDVLYIQ